MLAPALASALASVLLRVPVLGSAAQDPCEPAVAGVPGLEAGGEGQTAAARIQVPAGFQVELWAAEPLVANPVALWPRLDGSILLAETLRHHKGVTDIRDHMDWLDEDVASRTVEARVAMLRRHAGETFAEEYEHQSERIRLLSDQDGDGVADVSTLFADGFQTPAAGIGAGVLEWKGDVFYTCIPDLWKLADRDGDGRAEERELLSTGYGLHVALLGHDLHGLRIGPDGKLYFSCGDRGLHVETKEGIVDNWRSGSVLRCNLDGSGLEVFATGLRNPQDLVFDAYGNLFTGDNNSDGGDSARWVYVVEGGDSGWRYGYQWLTEPSLRGPWNDEKLWLPHFEGQAAYIVPPVADFSHGPSGCCAYPGTGFGEEWNGRFFLIDFEGTPGFSGIDSFRLAPKGASFELEAAEHFAWRFCATDCDFGPDGALYACDWTEGWEATGKGRIYRIGAPSQRAQPIVAELRRLLWEGMSDRAIPELAALLAHPDQRVRLEAELELAARGQAGLAALAQAAQGSISLFASLHGIWGMGVACARDRGASRGPLIERLGDGDPEVRAQAARVLGDLREPRAEATFVALLQDESPRVRFYAAIGLGRLGLVGLTATKETVEALFELARATGERDPLLRHGAITGLLGCATSERLLAARCDASLDARLAAIVALRRRGEARVAEFLGDPAPAARLETARAIYDEPIEAGMESLADELARAGALDHHLGRRALAAALALGGEDRARLLAHFAADSLQEEALRAEALVHLSRWTEPGGRDPFLGEWRPRAAHDAPYLPGLVASLEGQMLDDPKGERKAGEAAGTPARVAAAFVTLAGKVGAKGLSGRFTAIARDRERDPALRAAAIAALGSLGPGDLEATLSSTFFDREGRVRAASLASYQSAFPGKALPLLRVALSADGVEERRVALQGLGKISDPAADELLLGELEKQALGLFPAELALDLTVAAEARSSEKLFAWLKSRAEGRKTADPTIASYLDCQFGGDAAHGRKVFRENASLACLRCHRVSQEASDPAAGDGAGGSDGPGGPGGLGGVVGPDLFGLGGRLTRLQILESILDPNRNLSAGYEGVVFTLEDGTYVEGSVVAEAGGSVRVRTSEGGEVEIPVAEIESRRTGLSAMPEGLKQYVTREDLRDLIEYLGRL